MEMMLLKLCKLIPLESFITFYVHIYVLCRNVSQSKINLNEEMESHSKLNYCQDYRSGEIDVLFFSCHT